MGEQILLLTGFSARCDRCGGLHRADFAKSIRIRHIGVSINDYQVITRALSTFAMRFAGDWDNDVEMDAQTVESHLRRLPETRDYFIDLLFKEAGWALDRARDREYEVSGMPNTK